MVELVDSYEFYELAADRQEYCFPKDYLKKKKNLHYILPCWNKFLFLHPQWKRRRVSCCHLWWLTQRRSLMSPSSGATLDLMWVLFLPFFMSFYLRFLFPSICECLEFLAGLIKTILVLNNNAAIVQRGFSVNKLFFSARFLCFSVSFLCFSVSFLCYSVSFLCFSVSFLCFSVSFLCFSVSFLCYSVSFLCFSVSLLCFNVSFLCYSVSFLCFSVSFLCFSVRFLYISVSVFYVTVSVFYVSVSYFYVTVSVFYGFSIFSRTVIYRYNPGGQYVYSGRVAGITLWTSSCLPGELWSSRSVITGPYYASLDFTGFWPYLSATTYHVVPMDACMFVRHSSNSSLLQPQFLQHCFCFDSITLFLYFIIVIFILYCYLFLFIVISKMLMDQSDYVVVGVLGLQGVGKSTIVSHLASNALNLPEKYTFLYIFI